MAGTHFPSKSNPRFLSGLIGLRLVLLAPTLCLFVIAGQIAQAQTFAVLHTFTSENGDGATPYSGLIFDAEGNLYGTTKYGGFGDSGTVFELTPSGSEMELYPRTLCGNGLVGGLLRIKKNVYGTTYAGGSCFGQDDGSGSVFELVYSAKKKSYMGTTLFGFYGGLFGSEGERPEGTLIADEEGNVYGTTAYGGSTGYGLVYEITPGGTEIVLYTFCPDERDGCPDGGQPYGNLVRDGQGNLYGTTYYGGAYGLGTVFEVTPSGEETVLHSFGGGQDGGHPAAGLIRDVQGNFFGTTQSTVFEITPSGQETVLYTFCSQPNCTDGIGSSAPLIRDSKGDLYGTTAFGGTGTGCEYGSSCGTVFELVYSKKTKTYTEQVLYSFTGGTDGADPYGGLVKDKLGNLYGTTEQGGDLSLCYGRGCGTLFKLTP